MDPSGGKRERGRGRGGRGCGGRRGGVRQYRPTNIFHLSVNRDSVSLGSSIYISPLHAVWCVCVCVWGFFAAEADTTARWGKKKEKRKRKKPRKEARIELRCFSTRGLFTLSVFGACDQEITRFCTFPIILSTLPSLLSEAGGSRDVTIFGLSSSSSFFKSHPIVEVDYSKEKKKHPTNIDEYSD